jgi:hypothetical protein
MLPRRLKFKLVYISVSPIGLPRVDMRETITAHCCDLILEICLAWNTETEFVNLASGDS